MSHPKLWLQFLPPLEPALSPQAGRFPFPNLSPSEGWVLMAAVEGRLLVPVPRHGRESRRRPSWRGVPAPSSPDLRLGCAARPGRCALEAGSAPGPGHCLRGVFSGEPVPRPLPAGTELDGLRQHGTPRVQFRPPRLR